MPHATREYNLAVTHRAIAKQWHQTKNGSLTASDVTPASGKKAWWRCPSNQEHEWKATIGNRTKGSGCPVCAGQNRLETQRKTLLAKRGSLAEKNPEIAKQWHPTKNGKLSPHDVTSGSAEKVWWKCKKCDYPWQASIAPRTSRGVGCPACWKRNRGEIRRRANVRRKRERSAAKGAGVTKLESFGSQSGENS
jgi:hypothetical protein